MATVDITLYLGDCLDILPTLLPQSVDLIATDLPYGTTACKWDVIIPFEPMWECIKHVLKPNGAFITTASQPFTSTLVMSNLRWFKYEWIWEKNRGSNFVSIKYQPMKEHENILVFGIDKVNYYPIKEQRSEGGKSRSKYLINASNTGKREAFGKLKGIDSGMIGEMRVPRSVQKFNTEVGLHPTQKPVALYAYLIRTYSNPDDTVMDFCMGSGTTGVACAQLGRNFIGIETDEKYFNIANERIK